MLGPVSQAVLHTEQIEGAHFRGLSGSQTENDEATYYPTVQRGGALAGVGGCGE